MPGVSILTLYFSTFYSSLWKWVIKSGLPWRWWWWWWGGHEDLPPIECPMFTYYLEFFCFRIFLLEIYLINQSFIYINMNSCIFTLYFWVIIHTTLFILLLKSFQLWSQGNFSAWSQCPSDIPLFVEHIFGTTRWSGPIFYIPWPSPRISDLFNEPLFLLLENGI